MGNANLASVLCLAVLAGCAGTDDRVVTSGDPLDPTGSSALVPLPAREVRPQSPVKPVTFTKAAGSSSVSGSAASAGAPRVRIVALVGDSPVYEDELSQAVQQRVREWVRLPADRQHARKAEIREEELDRIIERELVVSELFRRLKVNDNAAAAERIRADAAKVADKRIAELMRRRGIKSIDDLAKAMAPQGLTIPGLKRQIARGHMMQQFMFSLVAPMAGQITLAQIRDYYRAHPDEFTTEDRVKWQDIFLPYSKYPTREAAHAAARSIADQARRGADFARLAEKHDQGDSSLRDGFGLGEKPGEIRPASMERVVLSLDRGQVAGPVAVRHGVHVVRAAERTRAGRLPFTPEVQDRIRGKLRERIGRAEFRGKVAELRRATPVRRWLP